MSYVAPVERILFDLEHIAGVYRNSSVDADSVRAILEEAGRFAAGTLAPLDRIGDTVGATFHDGRVTLPKGFREAYQAWAEAGWNSPDVPEDHGGMGLPVAVSVALMEFWTSACMAFGLGPVLTQGAIDVLHLHADAAMKEKYLPRMVSGEWAATMNLTEPQAGSDLAALRTRAVKQEDGSYRITGSKIFITCGEHDLTDNIIHLVLARLPDAPAGTRGISLFLVPKVFVDSDGSLGAPNDVRCAGIEHKAGIHASPTCVMVYGDAGGATGWLIGEENRGLACMFTMMNKARLFTALQGVAVGERATQRAISYARERRQGVVAGVNGQAPIILHPDVRRNLMTMRALTSASRALTSACARAIDAGGRAGDGAARAYQDARVAVLTPVAKSFCSDSGVEIASIGVQVHGGMGYVEETGAIQHWRNSRIVPIYEGANGIQAIDLVIRKLPLLGGRVVNDMFGEWRTAAEAVTPGVLTAAAGARLLAALDALEAATASINARDGDDRLALATPYLNLFATVAAAAIQAGGLVSALSGPRTPAFEEARADLAFYVDALLPRYLACAETLQAGSDTTLAATFA